MEIYDIDINLDKKEKLVYINISTTPGGIYQRFNTNAAKRVLKEKGIKFGKAIKKTTVHNGSNDPNTLNGTWIFELLEEPRPKRARTKKKTTGIQ